MTRPVSFTLFCLYVVFLILLPSGSIFGVNVKILVFVPLALLATQKALAEKEVFYRLAILACLLAAFLGWVLIAQCYGFYNIALSLSQYRDVTTTFAGCWFIRLFTANEIDRKIFVRVCLFTVAFGGLLKFLIFMYALSTGVPVSTIMDGIAHVFGVQLMTVELGDLGGRIQYPSDTLVPVCLFAILCLRKRLRIGGLVSLIMVSLLIVSSVFTFSRFLWGYTALGGVLGMLVAKRDRMHLLYLAGAAAVGAYFFKLLVTVVELRFSTQIADSSDAERILQRGALESFFRDAPLLGHGLGSYTTQVIRAPELPYNYEMQVFALAGQVGIVGAVLLLCVLFSYYRKAFSFRPGERIYQISVFLMLVCFLAAGFLNPYLVSSIAAGTFGLLFALASLGSCHEPLSAYPGGHHRIAERTSLVKLSKFIAPSGLKQHPG